MEPLSSERLLPRPELDTFLRLTLRRIYIDPSITSVAEFYGQSHDTATWDTIADIAHQAYRRLAFSSARENAQAVEIAVDHAVAYGIASNGLVTYDSLFREPAAVTE